MSTIAMLTSLLQDYKKSAGTDGSAALIGGASAPVAEESSASGQYGDAYLLDLSQEAQKILDSKSVPGIISLTDTQKEKLQTILDRYKNQPLDGDTLSKLEADLKQAGLAPQQLAAVQEAKGYSPLQQLLKILNNFGDETASSDGDVLSGLGSNASGTPLGDLANQLTNQSPDDL